jgi:protein SCO1
MPKSRKLRKLHQRRQTAANGLLSVLIVATVLLMVASGLFWLFTGAARLTASPVGGSFRLVASDGRTVTDRDFRGKYLLVYFGYTSCPDICPTTLNDIADALDYLGPSANAVQPLFITVDPQRDTREAIGKYMAAFTPRLIGLTGSPDQIVSAEKLYHVSAAVVRGDGPSSYYSIDHSAVLYLIAPDGNLVTALPADQTGAALAAAIRQHLSRG